MQMTMKHYLSNDATRTDLRVPCANTDDFLLPAQRLPAEDGFRLVFLAPFLAPFLLPLLAPFLAPRLLPFLLPFLPVLFRPAVRLLFEPVRLLFLVLVWPPLLDLRVDFRADFQIALCAADTRARTEDRAERRMDRRGSTPSDRCSRVTRD